jgi:5-methylthioadenosine/S-adenosylhomocysteine deaminase
LITAAGEYAKKIDIFLMAREQSVLSKLIALGGSSEEESFEVQAKVSLPNPDAVYSGLKNPAIEIVRKRHYHQHDIYLSFDNPAQGQLRYREDDFIDNKGHITNSRARLTHIGPERAGKIHDVLVSRSRYLSPAAHSARFYREYFKPQSELIVEKDRERWLIRFNGDEFFINLDHFIDPKLGYFLEVKSRTWSRKDAEEKAPLVEQLITLLGASMSDAISEGYAKIITQNGKKAG